MPSGTTYLLEPEFATALADAAGVRHVIEGDAASAVDLSDQRKRKLQEAVLRSGQALFHRNVLYADDCQCVVSGTAVEECLEAAHIVPHRGDHTDRTANGILLRADIHRLFDAGLIRIHPETKRVTVDKLLCGTDYEKFEGTSVDRHNRLDEKSLRWRWLHPAGIVADEDETDAASAGA